MRHYQKTNALSLSTLLVDSEDSSRDYLSSSPTNGAESVKEGYVAKDPGSELYGDSELCLFSETSASIAGYPGHSGITRYLEKGLEF